MSHRGLLRLSLACGDYDINHGLIDGSDTVKGVELATMTMSWPERHWRLMCNHEFDLCEFSMASYLAMRDQLSDRRVSLAWVREALEEQRRVLGPDPWPYHLPGIYHGLDALCGYAHAQGRTRKRLKVDELFFPAAADEPPRYVGA